VNPTASATPSLPRRIARHVALELGALTITLAVFMFVGISGMTAASCSWSKAEVKSTEAQISACAKAEESAAAKGVDVIQLAEEIVAEAAVIAASGGVVAALETAVLPLIEKYGEPVVACVVKDKLGIGQGSAAGSGSASHAAPSPEHLLLFELAAKRGWDK
jgi:hypothetical protein